MNLLHGVVVALLLLQTINTGHHRGNGGPPPLNPCLVSAWAMTEGSGLTLHDALGVNTATISAAPAVVWTSNNILTGATTPVWSGSGDALATSTTLTNFTNVQPFSVSAWVKFTGGVEQIFASTFAGGGGSGWEFQSAASGNTLNFILANNYSSNALQVRSNSSIPTGGTVSYVVATYDGSQNPTTGVKMYIQGASVATTTLVNSLSSTSANGTPLNLAQRPGGVSRLVGGMAFVEVYNCVVTSGFVSSSFAAGPGIY